MVKLKKLVGDKNKSIVQYFDDEQTAVEWIQENIATPKSFDLFELKGIVSDCLANKDVKKVNTKTATEILAEIGYKIIKTNSLQELKNLNFETWFDSGDRWCKYRDNGRWNAYDIYIIYKEDAKDLKPMKNPKVGDEYSLSLMSLGCLDGRIFQICQRYNHSAKGSADWALGGNLDNLVDGLSEAFCKEFGYESLGTSRKYMPDNTVVRHGKYLKYNYEINDVYFYADGVCTNVEFMYTDKERYTIVDYFVVDWKEKKVYDPAGTKDGLIPPLTESLQNGTLVIEKI